MLRTGVMLNAVLWKRRGENGCPVGWDPTSWSRAIMITNISLGPDFLLSGCTSLCTLVRYRNSISSSVYLRVCNRCLWIGDRNLTGTRKPDSESPLAKETREKEGGGGCEGDHRMRVAAKNIHECDYDEDRFSMDIVATRCD